jgi:hypothetical protein
MAESEGEALLPKRAARCPSCNAPGGAIRRWSQSSDVWRASCSRCGKVWQERSARNLMDALLDRRDLIGFGVMILAALVALGALVLLFVELLRQLGLNLDQDSSIAVFVVLAVISVGALIVIGRQKAS